MVGPFVAQVYPGLERARGPVARHLARQTGHIQRLQLDFHFVARQRQQLLHQVGAALSPGKHLGQPCAQGLWVAFSQRQLGLTDQAGQRRA